MLWRALRAMDLNFQQQQQLELCQQRLNCTSESRTGESVADHSVSIMLFITPVFFAFLALGSLGNIIILHAICTVRRFNRAENLMLANLSATSILIMVSAISFYTDMTRPFNLYGPLYCKFYAGIRFCMVPAEGFTMMCISLERTQGARFPLIKANAKVSALKKIGLIWIFALLLDLPRGFLFYKYDPGTGSFIKCLNTKEIWGSWIPYAIYVTSSYSLTYLLPAVWLAHDWMRLVSQLHFLIACQTLPLQCEYRRRQKKLVGHAIIFTSIFIAVKVPVGTHYFLYQLPPELLSETVIAWVQSWKQVFFTVNLLYSSFYPFIIFGLSRDIRKYLFCCESDRPPHPVSRV